MSFMSMISIAIAITAVVAVFAYIPYVSDYAFWVLVLAYLVWFVDWRPNAKNWFRVWLMASLAVLVLAIVGLFANIPIISTYPFWILMVAYLIIVGSTRMLPEK